MKFVYDISPVLLPSIEAERVTSLVTTNVADFLNLRFTQMLEEMLRKHAVLPLTQTGAVPSSVSRRAGMQALIDLNMIASVEASIAALPETTESEIKFKRTVQNEYNNAQEFERNRPALVYMLKDKMGKTDAEIDALFVYAATLA